MASSRGAAAAGGSTGETISATDGASVGATAILSVSRDLDGVIAGAAGAAAAGIAADAEVGTIGDVILGPSAGSTTRASTPVRVRPERERGIATGVMIATGSAARGAVDATDRATSGTTVGGRADNADTGGIATVGLSSVEAAVDPSATLRAGRGAAGVAEEDASTAAEDGSADAAFGADAPTGPASIAGAGSHVRCAEPAGRTACRGPGGVRVGVAARTMTSGTPEGTDARSGAREAVGASADG